MIPPKCFPNSTKIVHSSHFILGQAAEPRRIAEDWYQPSSHPKIVQLFDFFHKAARISFIIL